MQNDILQSQIAVMQAAAEGKRIQAKSSAKPSTGFKQPEWFSCPRPEWNWILNNYRVDPTDIDYVKAPVDRTVFEGRPVWVRWDPSKGLKDPARTYFSVLNIGDFGLRVYQGASGPSPEGFRMVSFQYALEWMEYSYDCKFWHPFYKMVPASPTATTTKVVPAAS